MKNFNPESYFSKKIESLDYENYILEKLKEIFQFKNQEILKKYPFLDQELRINIKEASKRLFDINDIESDLKKVENLEKKFLNIEEKKNFIIGEIFEISKTLISNKIFKNGLVFRTSKYDDYLNGVDEIFIDKKSGEVLAVIDTTTNIFSKDADIIIDRIINGAKIKYGLKIITEENKRKIIWAKNLNNLPVLYLYLKKEKVNKLAEAIIDNNNQIIEEIVNEIKKNLIFFIESVINKVILSNIDNKNLDILNDLRKKYEQIRKIIY